MTQTPLAVIGMAVRLPGADTVEKYWDDALDGVVHIERFTPEQLVQAGLDEAQAHDPGFVGASALLDDVDGFDAGAFGMSPREAAITDPQHRLFMEVCHTALETSGYSGDTSKVGLFGNTGFHLHPLGGYLRNNLDGRVFNADFARNQVTGLQVAFGNHTDFVATKTAFRLGLTGPVMTVQTGCSSGLVGVHLAGQALRGDEADVVVVATAAVHIPQVVGHRYVKGSIHSRSGVCRVFDAASDGMVTGNGAAAVVLKRLDRALADGDSIDAVVLGTAINNDGASKSAYAAPSVDGQAEVVERALTAAGVNCGDIGYVETHGTGTFKGDPIEFAALERTYRHHTDKVGYCGLGSAKANIGHLDSAAALPSLIRAIGVIHRGVIPPLANHTAPNPGLPLDRSPFYLPDRRREWPIDLPRLAAVTALGVGGTNAHLILGLPDRSAAYTDVSRPKVSFLPLSAATSQSLTALASAWHRRLLDEPDLNPADVAATAGAGRRHHRLRLAVLGSTVAQWCQGLSDFLSVNESGRYRTGEASGTGTALEMPPDADAYCRGASIAWPDGGRRLRLPSYPYHRTAHWIGPAPPQADRSRSSTGDEDMSFNTVLAHITEATTKRLGHPADRVTPDSSFLELGADSLSMVDLARGLEEAFGVKVSMRELFEEGATPGELAALVAARLPTNTMDEEQPEPTPSFAQPVPPTPSVAQPVPPPPSAPPTVPLPPVQPPAPEPVHMPAPVPPPPVYPYTAEAAASARTVEALTAQVQQLISINQQLTYQVSQLTAMLRSHHGGGRA